MKKLTKILNMSQREGLRSSSRNQTDNNSKNPPHTGNDPPIDPNRTVISVDPNNPQSSRPPQVANSNVVVTAGMRSQANSDPEGNVNRDNSQGTDDTIPSPSYSSLTAQNIRNEVRSQGAPQNLRLNQIVRPTTTVNDNGLTLEEYVAASVGLCQAQMLREMNEIKKMLQDLHYERGAESELNPDFINSTNIGLNQGLPPPNVNIPGFHPNVPPPSSGHPLQTNNNPNNQIPLYRNNDPYNQQPIQNQQPPYYPPQQGASYYLHEQNATWYPNRNINSYDLDKWGIRFDGTAKTVDIKEFIFRVEAIKEDKKCPESVLLKNFHQLLSGEAYEWLWSFRRQNPRCRWEQLKFSLEKKFKRHESDYEIQRKIMDRRQGYNESCEAFINDIIILRNQMKAPIPEIELVIIVKENLKDNIVQLVYPMRIIDIDHLIEECKRAERNILKRRSDYNRNRPVARVHELEYDSQENFLVHELNSANTAPIRRICWNCKLPGHSFFECSSSVRNLFCYRCGTDNVITPNCPRCSGNRQGNMPMTGAACSKQPQHQ